MTNFNTNYKNAYTVPVSADKETVFKSKYSSKHNSVIISNVDRPKELKFKSRLVIKK